MVKALISVWQSLLVSTLCSAGQRASKLGDRNRLQSLPRSTRRSGSCTGTPEHLCGRLASLGRILSMIGFMTHPSLTRLSTWCFAMLYAQPDVTNGETRHLKADTWSLLIWASSVTSPTATRITRAERSRTFASQNLLPSKRKLVIRLVLVANNAKGVVILLTYENQSSILRPCSVLE